MEKKNSFESNIENLDRIIENLERGDLGLDESIKEYERAMKLIKKSSEMLKAAEGKIIKVSERNEELEFSEVE